MKDNLSQLTGRKEESFIHTVKWPGETISIVAKWYTGSVDHWKQIAKINPGLNPKKIVIGNKISIPKSLLKTTKPLPETFVSEFYMRNKIIPGTSETAAPPRMPKKRPAPAAPPTEAPTVSPAASPRPASEKMPPGAANKEPSEEKEPVLFGPKGYSN